MKKYFHPTLLVLTLAAMVSVTAFYLNEFSSKANIVMETFSKIEELSSSDAMVGNEIVTTQLKLATLRIGAYNLILLFGYLSVIRLHKSGT